jgi:hypothetical protein
MGKVQKLSSSERYNPLQNPSDYAKNCKSYRQQLWWAIQSIRNVSALPTRTQAMVSSLFSTDGNDSPQPCLFTSYYLLENETLPIMQLFYFCRNTLTTWSYCTQLYAHLAKSLILWKESFTAYKVSFTYYHVRKCDNRFTHAKVHFVCRSSGPTNNCGTQTAQRFMLQRFKWDETTYL